MRFCRNLYSVLDDKNPLVPRLSGPGPGAGGVGGMVRLGRTAGVLDRLQPIRGFLHDDAEVSRAQPNCDRADRVAPPSGGSSTFARAGQGTRLDMGRFEQERL